jgi:hypothetical protein
MGDLFCFVRESGAIVSPCPYKRKIVATWLISYREARNICGAACDNTLRWAQGSFKSLTFLQRRDSFAH